MMKHALRWTRLLEAIWFAALECCMAANAQSGGSACTRENLKGTYEKCLAALEAHSPSGLPLASNVKYTENGTEVAVGKGFWETAGKVLLKRSLIDTVKCGAHTQAVIEEKGKPILFGVRLKLHTDKISEIESIIAREKDFAFKPQGVLDTKDHDWESILPPGQRSSHLQ